MSSVLGSGSGIGWPLDSGADVRSPKTIRTKNRRILIVSCFIQMTELDIGFLMLRFPRRRKLELK